MSNLNVTLKNTYWFAAVLSFLFYFILYFNVLKLEFQLNSVNTLVAEVWHLEHSSTTVKQQAQKWLNVYAKPLRNFPKSMKKIWKLLLSENVYDKTHETSYTK